MGDLRVQSYAPEWQSLKRYRIPAWFHAAKFGIFIQWGPYSVPAFGSECYPYNMYVANSAEFHHHLATYGPQESFGYKDFVPQFTAEYFDPSVWAALFRDAGARYVTTIAEFNDGFSMYETPYSAWNAAEVGPRCDIVAALTDAIRQEGLNFGLAYHRANHWWFFHEGRNVPSDVQQHQYAGIYGPAQPLNTQPDQAFLEDWLARAQDIVDRFQPNIFALDEGVNLPIFEPYLQRFAAYYYNRAAQRGTEAIITYKQQAFPAGTAVVASLPNQTNTIRAFPWQASTSVASNSAAHVSQMAYKPIGELIGELVDVVSKNGTFLLTIGPEANGRIPEREEQILRTIGEWLEVNGEAIYDTRPWFVFGEGPQHPERISERLPKALGPGDIRFTRSANALYIIYIGQPSGPLSIRSLAYGSPLRADAVHSIRQLGTHESLQWSQDSRGLHISGPFAPSDYATTIKLTFKG